MLYEVITVFPINQYCTYSSRLAHTGRLATFYTLQSLATAARFFGCSSPGVVKMQQYLGYLHQFAAGIVHQLHSIFPLRTGTHLSGTGIRGGAYYTIRIT